MLMIEPMYVAEALSYQTESPSDALYTMVIGRVKDAEGNQWVFNAAGYGGCYAKSDGFYTYAFAEYSISDVTVEKLSVFR